MEIESTVEEMTLGEIRRALAGFPRPDGYAIRVIPLRYRGDKPHLSAWTDFDEHRITIQIPTPFFPFGEIVPYAAQRRRGKGMRFIWLTEGVTFHTPRDALRFLYLHEWMHWFLKERHHRKSQAETTCDRFALRNYQKSVVTLDDAREAMKRRSSASHRVNGSNGRAR